jgi:hypothetical protein
MKLLERIARLSAKTKLTWAAFVALLATYGAVWELVREHIPEVFSHIKANFADVWDDREKYRKELIATPAGGPSVPTGSNRVTPPKQTR